MSYDREAFVDKLYQIEEKKKQILAFGAERAVTEEALAVEYKVDECNSKRTLLIKTFKTQTSVLQNEIQELRDSLVV